jgi:hypothetical protein
LSTSISFTLPSYEKTREVQQVPILKFAVVRRTENDENFNVEFDKDETVGIWSRYQWPPLQYSYYVLQTEIRWMYWQAVDK